MRSPEKPSGASIAARIVTRLIDEAQEARVADVRIGLGYTAVLLAGGGAGVAFTFRDQARGGCSVFDGVRPLAARPAADLLVLLTSRDPIEAGVGLACANALTNKDEAAYLGGDILDQLELRPEDHVGMVGNFGPLVSAIQKRVRSLTVFERIDKPAGMIRPAQEALTLLPRCQVALITATALINHTLDGLLKATAGCREVVVLGPSVPLLPEVFAGQNVTLLSGVVVKDQREVLKVVSEGGGMRQFSPYVRKVSRRLKHDKPDKRGVPHE